jgi:hypothetical protein
MARASFLSRSWFSPIASKQNVPLTHRGATPSANIHNSFKDRDNVQDEKDKFEL